MAELGFSGLPNSKSSTKNFRVLSVELVSMRTLTSCIRLPVIWGLWGGDEVGGLLLDGKEIPDIPWPHGLFVDTSTGAFTLGLAASRTQGHQLRLSLSCPA